MAEKAPKTAAATPASRTIYTLSEPVDYNGETVAEIAYRKPTARDMRMWFNSQSVKGLGDRYVDFLVNVCEMPAAFFDAIPPGDWMALTDIVDGFFARPKPAA